MPAKAMRRCLWVVRGGRRYPTNPKLAQIVALLERGVSYEAIAAAYGITRQAVYAIRKKSGLPGRNGKT
jgi:DNA invertase Pin-like site-specific DNA recombinase